jgi:hypothetical protein
MPPQLKLSEAMTAPIPLIIGLVPLFALKRNFITVPQRHSAYENQDSCIWFHKSWNLNVKIYYEVIIIITATPLLISKFIGIKGCGGNDDDGVINYLAHNSPIF